MDRINRIACWLALWCCVALVGCAHPINVEPDVGRLRFSAEIKLPATVAIRIPAEIANLEVTTTGGGGDNVRYQPYASIFTGYQAMLKSLFEAVVTMPDVSAVRTSKIDYILTPAITTNSGGSNFFTWPPETFTVDLTTHIRDRDGRLIASPHVVGQGQASTAERLGDHGYSGRRAFEDALHKMHAALSDWGRQLQAPAASSNLRQPGAEERLKQLKDLLERKLLSEQEYETKRQAILADL